MTSASLLKVPSAWLPIAMSLAALVVVLIHIARFGIAREADEGAAAHIWQVLMATQVPIVAYFALRWVPRSPMRGLIVVAVQLAAAVTALAPVFALGL
jgi:hypothetical protein